MPPPCPPSDDRLIILVGLPGSGKTTVGRQLARRLKCPFLDTDHEIEKTAGSSIRHLFEQHGEPYFRDLEESVIDQLTLQGAGVLSTGGGAVLRPTNRERMRDRGTVFYLRSSPEDIFRRIRHDNSRPLLQVDDPLQKLKDLFELRDPLYRQAAHFVVDTGRPSVATLVNTLQMQLELAGAG